MTTTTLKSKPKYKYSVLVLSISVLALVTMAVLTIQSKAMPFNPLAKNDTTPTSRKAILKTTKPHPTCVIRSAYGHLFTAVYNAGQPISSDSLSHIAEGAILFLDGKPISMNEFWDLNKQETDEIHSANIWKGKDAIKKFGKSGSKGVVEFFKNKIPV